MRHQREFCNVIMPRRRSHNRIDGNQKVRKSNKLIECSSLDFIEMLSSMLNEQRYRWRKDFKELKDALLPPGNSDSFDEDEEPDSTDDEEHNSNVDEA